MAVKLDPFRLSMIISQPSGIDVTLASMVVADGSGMPGPVAFPFPVSPPKTFA